MLTQQIILAERSESILTEVRRAVFNGPLLRTHYAEIEQPTNSTTSPSGQMTSILSVSGKNEARDSGPVG